MTFVKGNQEARKKRGVKHNQAVEEYLQYLSSGAARHYYNNLEKLFCGQELPKAVKEGMDRFERNTEYIAAKLARIENTGQQQIEHSFKWKTE